MTKKAQKKWCLPPVSEVKVFLACPSEKAKISKSYVLLRPTLKAFFLFFRVEFEPQVFYNHNF